MIPIVRLDTTDSTNNEAWKFFDKYSKFILLAAEQTNGKGTQGREWVSVRGNFFASFCEELQLSSMISDIPLKVGVRVAKVLNSLGSSVLLQWPNDLVVSFDDSFRKIGGILCESRFQGDQLRLVMGVGINLVSAPEETTKPSGTIFLDYEQLFIALAQSFEQSILEEDLSLYNSLDFFFDRCVQTQSGIVGIGAGLFPLDGSYTVKVQDGFVFIKDPDRLRLA